MSDLDLQQAADEIGMSREWLRKQVTAQLVPCQRYGREVRFTPEQMAQIRAMHEQPVVAALFARPRLVVASDPRPSTPPSTPKPPPGPTAPPKATGRKASA